MPKIDVQKSCEKPEAKTISNKDEAEEMQIKAKNKSDSVDKEESAITTTSQNIKKSLKLDLQNITNSSNDTLERDVINMGSVEMTHPNNPSNFGNSNKNYSNQINLKDLQTNENTNNLDQNLKNLDNNKFNSS